MAQLEAALGKAEQNAGSSNLTEVQKQMAAQIDELLKSRAEIEKKYLEVNEKNKSLRHKAGQVFL